MNSVPGLSLKVARLHQRDDGKSDVIARSEGGDFYLLAAVSPPLPELESDIVLPPDWRSDPALAVRIAKIEFTD